METEREMVKKVGIVGMGLMGQAFILNMRKSQFIIQGFDVDSNRMDELREQGGTPVNTPADAAKDWVKVQNVAEELGYKLVSPAVSTTGADVHGVSPWLDQFFGNCSN